MATGSGTSTSLATSVTAQPRRGPVVVAVKEPGVDSPHILASIYELTKPRITRLVTMTAGVGYVLALTAHYLARPQPRGPLADIWALSLSVIACLLGTAFSSSGANALNMWWERSRDARMKRTCTRPIPTGAMSPGFALVAGLSCSLIGVALLASFNGLPAAAISLGTILIYVLIYTPSKPVTTLNTLIGAVPGALPPMIGWAAGIALIQPLSAIGEWNTWAGGLSLFALMCVWQIPHFLAIAWMYREDYAAGGFRMLPSIDPTGRLTAMFTVLGACVLLPATLMPAWAIPHALGLPYQIIAVVSGGLFFALTVRLAMSMTPGRARAVFFASIIHLPLLLIAMVAEAFVRSLG